MILKVSIAEVGMFVEAILIWVHENSKAAEIALSQGYGMHVSLALVMVAPAFLVTTLAFVCHAAAGRRNAYAVHFKGI